MTYKIYKSKIDDLVNNRYKYLLECSTNILKQNTSIEPYELVSELIIYLYNNQEKVSEFISINKLEAFCVSWLNIQGKYQTSPTNKKYSQKEFEWVDNMDIVLDDNITHTYTDKNDYEKELHTIYTNEQVKNIMNVDKIYDYLSKSEKILFNAYFVENLSYDKICKKYTFFREKDGKRITYKSKKSIYNLMKGLRYTIITLINDNNGNNI